MSKFLEYNKKIYFQEKQDKLKHKTKYYKKKINELNLDGDDNKIINEKIFNLSFFNYLFEDYCKENNLIDLEDNKEIPKRKINKKYKIWNSEDKLNYNDLKIFNDYLKSKISK